MADDHQTPMPGTPTGASTILEALDWLTEQGYGGNLFVVEGGLVRCGACRHDTPAAQLDLAHLIRLEGASDPAEMAAVLGLRCHQCGATGAAVVRYGPEASPDEAEVLRAVEDQRRGVPGSSLPDQPEEGPWP